MCLKTWRKHSLRTVFSGYSEKHVGLHVSTHQVGNPTYQRHSCTGETKIKVAQNTPYYWPLPTYLSTPTEALRLESNIISDHLYSKTYRDNV